jgi:hypothetical protein
MARTSKTTLNQGKSDEMVRASAQGQQSVDNARAGLNQQQQFGVQQTNRMAADVGGLMGQHQDRQQQQGQFNRQMQQREDETDLDAAKSGFQRKGGDRAARLQEEMERGAQQGGVGALDPESQQRLQQQGAKPLEDAGGKWVPTDERKQDAQRKNFEADTDRIKAESYADQIGLQVQRAALKGERETAAKLSKTLAQPVNQSVESFDRLLNAEMGEGAVKDSDWTDLEAAAAGGPDADPTLMADLQARKFTPRVQQFARAQISREAVKYIARTGDTGNLKVDWTAPMMRQFTEQVQQMNLMAKAMGPEFSRFAGINSIEDKMAFLNQQAAMAVYMGMGMAPGGDPTGGMPPSAGGQGMQRPQQMQQGQQAPQLQHTPDAASRIEQGRQAGAARRAGNPPPPIGFPDENRDEGARERNPSFRPGPK